MEHTYCAEGPRPSIEAVLRGMTLRERIGQLFLVRPDALDFTLPQESIDDSRAAGVTALTEGMRRSLADYPVGGVALFSKNIVSPDQLRAFIGAWQGASRLPLWIAVDEEGGPVARIGNHPAFRVPRYESAAAVGSTGDPAAAREMGRTIDAYLLQFGFNLNFAPVADVNTNRRTQLMGARAFSDDPAQAARMVEAAVQGFHDAGIACTIKHFPGHGDTAEDSHFGCATTHKTWDALVRCEMLPFAAGIAAGADLVMSSHVTAPNVTGDGLPASLSGEMVTGRLRGELGFGGVIITDSLAMKAVSAFYSPADAACMALAAGNDILLMPDDLRQAFDGVLAAVHSGAISQSRIDESVRRVLTLKRSRGIL